MKLCAYVMQLVHGCTNEPTQVTYVTHHEWLVSNSNIHVHYLLILWLQNVQQLTKILSNYCRRVWIILRNQVPLNIINQATLTGRVWWLRWHYMLMWDNLFRTNASVLIYQLLFHFSHHQHTLILIILHEKMVLRRMGPHPEDHIPKTDLQIVEEVLHEESSSRIGVATSSK